MSTSVQIYTVIAMIIIAVVCGIYRYKYLDGASRILLLMISIGLSNEIIAYYFAKVYHNNMKVYNSYSIVELFILSLYFDKSIAIFQKWHIGIYIGSIGVVLGITNFLFLQSLSSFSTNYLLFEGFCIILMALIAFYYLLLNQDDLRLYRYPHFWFTSILLFFWSVTYVTWGIFPIIHSKENVKLVGTFLSVVNAISYIAITLVFLLYPKMKVTNE